MVKPASLFNTIDCGESKDELLRFERVPGEHAMLTEPERRLTMKTERRQSESSQRPARRQTG
jgi:hypothetical protein